MKFKKQVNWGLSNSYVEFEVIGFVTGFGQIRGEFRREFSGFDQQREVTLRPGIGEGGKINFDIRASYKLYENVMGVAVPKYQGSFVYRAWFPYSFDDSGDTVLNRQDLIINKGDAKELYEKGDKALRFSGFDWDFVDGTKRGKTFVRVTPHFLLPSKSITESKGVSYIGSWSTGYSMSFPAIVKRWGGFRLNLDVYRITFPVPQPVLPPLDMQLILQSFTVVGFKKENQRELDAKIASEITAWKNKLITQYPAVQQALRDGKINVYFDGYASHTGGTLYNDRLSGARAEHVRDYIKLKLGVPKEKTSVMAFGDEKAEKWKSTVARRAREAIKPRTADRVVVIWMKPDELHKVVRGKR